MTFALGLTGSIGMGKSTTAQMFADDGIPVWDADRTVHALYAPGGAAVDPVAARFPRAVVDGAVSRDRLKALITTDPTVLGEIERIVHPLVARSRSAFVADASTDIALFDIPLLYETKADHWLDAVVVVTTSPEIQRARLLGRGTMTQAGLDAILARQMPDAEKRARADYVIETLSLDAARAAVRNVIADIRGKRDA